MHQIIQRIEYKGYQIEERRITSAGGAVVSTPRGGRQAVPPASIPLTQWAIIKVSPAGEEQDVAVASSQDDARRKVDELAG